MPNAFLRVAKNFAAGRRQGASLDRVELGREIEAHAIQQRLEAADDTMTALLEELADLRARQQLVENMLEMAGAPATGAPVRRAVPPRPIVIKVGEYISAGDYLPPFNGFYPVETAPDGRMFRWTGPQNEFLIDVEIQCLRPAHFELSLLGALFPQHCENVGVQVAGNWIVSTAKSDREGTTISFVLPARRQAGCITLVFVVPKVGRPSGGGAGAGDDNRMLGVRFHELRYKQH